MPLPDGTNDEKEDVSPPLNYTSKEDLKNVVLHGAHASPPCIKIRLLLKYYGVNFTTTTKKAGGSYKKVPVLKINDRQINDSYIIFKNLIPILSGEVFAEEWQNKITYELQPSIEAESFGDTKGDMHKFATKGAGYPGCIVCCIAGSMGPKIARKIREKNPGLPRSVEVGKQFLAAIGDKAFFGGEKPGQVDIAYYGTLLGFVHCGCTASSTHLEDAGLQQWWSQMAQHMPDVMKK